MSDSPRTEAGKRVLDLDYRMVEWWNMEGTSYSLAQVVKRSEALALIEAEAASLGRRRSCSPGSPRRAREVPPPPVGPPAPIPPGFGSPQQLPPANLSLMGTVTKGRAVQPDPLTGDVAANFQTSAATPDARPIGNPLGKFIKGEIDGDEYVRQTNEKRKRHGLPPLVAATPDAHPDWPHPPWGDDEDKAEGLLTILRQNARYTDGHTRNVRAIVGFIAGLRAGPAR